MKKKNKRLPFPRGVGSSYQDVYFYDGLSMYYYDD